ncbi:interferon epsilon-like [Pelodiscus sinensis]|uniref:interferon epsilon-like n=1 Tax=Pelodiscus sinensis TaxID=13735 RepID=UPI0007047255|nr:interferon epsilon-like [Pelodiscus sinensis]XP_006130057.2 interferon epsilon-like [Pelodiscus sinensis]XP_006130058.2 interferon epsilon-like [Pelodiscus sinensis]UYF04968.1 type I interferon 3 [Pelodiscus sinensis]|eukprot:XP_006130056.2 interferon epsilon-like [Pelodiscus sinensis]
MSILSFLHICLVLHISTKISFVDCNMFLFQQNKVNQDSLKLLEKMGGQFPVQCLNEKSNFISLQNLFSSTEFQKENAMMVIQEILQQSFTIFRKIQIQTDWDRSSIAAFQNGLYQQIELLKTWFDGEKKMETTYPQNEDLTRLKVKKYFHVIDTFLEKRQYSRCACEIIREEMRRCFLFIDQLTKRLKN